MSFLLHLLCIHHNLVGSASFPIHFAGPFYWSESQYVLSMFDVFFYYEQRQLHTKMRRKKLKIWFPNLRYILIAGINTTGGNSKTPVHEIWDRKIRVPPPQNGTNWVAGTTVGVFPAINFMRGVRDWRCAVREIGVYWYLFSNLVVWCRGATLPNANFE